jgi:D-threo-aldose 1-dehydrogenase
LQFSLHDERIASTIVGITRSERLTQTITLAQQPIPDQLWTEIATL